MQAHGMPGHSVQRLDISAVGHKLSSAIVPPLVVVEDLLIVCGYCNHTSMAIFVRQTNSLLYCCAGGPHYCVHLQVESVQFSVELLHAVGRHLIHIVGHPSIHTSGRQVLLFPSGF
ncbi:hypothetical protein VTN00DRAFT_1293 [Thermoascus crustaceus]|uniref:uncharacterized protein n=1 Tax=Thermoascus crustaceus TaxID=5088 RepID=UPI0037423B80